jgi:hypothetical protein
MGPANVDLGAQVTAVEVEDERADVATDVEHGRTAQRRGVAVAVIVLVVVAVPVMVVVAVPVIEHGTHADNGTTS